MLGLCRQDFVFVMVFSNLINVMPSVFMPTKLRAWLVLRNFIHILQVMKLYVCLAVLCRLVRAAHAKGANIILIQVCIVGTFDINFCSIWLL